MLQIGRIRVYEDFKCIANSESLTAPMAISKFTLSLIIIIEKSYIVTPAFVIQMDLYGIRKVYLHKLMLPVV